MFPAIVFSILSLLATPISSDNTLCCNYGTSSDIAGKSCMDIIRFSPGCKDLSGDYWIELANGTAVEVYCDMNTLGGGWERVGYYDSLVDTNCPGTMGNYLLGSYHVCTNNNGSGNITSAEYTPITETYSQIMGLMTGYISDEPHGFAPNGDIVTDLNDAYMDGIALLIDDDSGNYKHIHSAAVAGYGNSFSAYRESCYVIGQDEANPPFGIRDDHSCTTIYYIMYMLLDGTIDPAKTRYFGDNWNGVCLSLRYFCRDIDRYFIKTLPKELTSDSNTLLVSVMSQSSIVVGMNFLDIYVR